MLEIEKTPGAKELLARKLGPWLAEIREVLGYYLHRLRHPPLTIEHHDKGSEIAERYGFSFYDSTIISSVPLAKCKILYSEDS